MSQPQSSGDNGLAALMSTFLQGILRENWGAIIRVPTKAEVNPETGEIKFTEYEERDSGVQALAEEIARGLGDASTVALNGVLSLKAPENSTVGLRVYGQIESVVEGTVFNITETGGGGGGGGASGSVLVVTGASVGAGTLDVDIVVTACDVVATITGSPSITLTTATLNFVNGLFTGAS